MAIKKKKRKAKTQEDLKRPIPQVETSRRILIVCEGEKTEPNYFEGLVRYHRLQATDVDIKGDCGSSPKSVVKYAKDLLKKSVEDNNEYDKVFCVFDRDSHVKYLEAIGDITHARGNVLECCNSVPSFEFWYLLHFVETRKSYTAKGNSSPGDEVIKDFKKEFKGYKKNDRDMYAKLYEYQDRAIAHAKKVLKDAEQVNDYNPSTNVHKLVCNLLNKPV